MCLIKSTRYFKTQVILSHFFLLPKNRLTKRIVVRLDILQIEDFNVGVDDVLLGEVAPVSGQEVDRVEILPAGPVLGVQLRSQVVNAETRFHAIHKSANKNDVRLIIMIGGEFTSLKIIMNEVESRQTITEKTRKVGLNAERM